MGTFYPGNSTQFGGLPRTECAALGFSNTIDNRGIENGSKIMLNLEKNTGRKRPTVAIRLGFLIENFWYNYLLKSFIRIPIQILVFLFTFPHTERKAAVIPLTPKPPFIFDK